MKKDKNIEAIFAIKDKLFRIANRLLGSEIEASDAVQDLYLKILEKRKALDEHPKKEAFAVSTLKNLCIDKLRKKKNSYADDIMLNNVSFSENIEQKMDINAIISKALSELPEKQKLIFQLRDIEGYEYVEICEITGLTVSAVKTNLSRARKLLRDIIINRYKYEYK